MSQQRTRAQGRESRLTGRQGTNGRNRTRSRSDFATARKDEEPGQLSTNSHVRKEVVFQVDAPTAGMVALAADFTNWDKAPIRMLRLGDGIWQAKVALPQGRHRYKFLVDGRWLEEPSSAERVANPFGTMDGVIDVP